MGRRSPLSKKRKGVGSPVKKCENPCCVQPEQNVFKKRGESRVGFFGGRVDKGREEKRMRLIDQGREKKRWKAAPKEEGEKERKKRTSFLLRRRGNNGCSRKGCQEKKERKGAVAIVVL